ncbi:unnamed protein product [Arabidopsis halleri]
MICSYFVASRTGVFKYHRQRPNIRPKQVYVAHHTSMIDFIVLEQMTAFAIVMQKHPCWVGKSQGLLECPEMCFMIASFLYRLVIDSMTSD